MATMQFTEAQLRFLNDRGDEFKARCEAASWVVYRDRRFCGCDDAFRTEIVRRSTLRAMGAKLKPLALSRYKSDTHPSGTSFADCLNLEGRAYAAALEARVPQAA